MSDPSGAAVPGATVVLTQVAIGVTRAVTTGADGSYHFASLAPGDYRAVASAQGFANTAVTFSLTTAQTLNLPIALRLSTQRQAVEITAQPPVLDTAETRSQMTLRGNALATLPMAGRSVLGLVTLAPGVEGLGSIAGGSPGSAQDNFSTETQVDASANGRGSDTNMYVVDGLDITSDARPGVLNLVPNPDSLQEVSVQTNTFTVAYGRVSSMQVIMATKAGTNKYHGNLSDYFTNQYLWAGTEFVHNYTPFRSNNFSGTLGGPLPFKHQSFFFVSAEPLRSSVSTGNNVFTFESPQFVQFAQQNFPNTLGTELLTSHPPSGATATGVSRTAANIFPTTCGTPLAANIQCNLPM
ncbi:MAG: carboxypeptidase regulatory-like domain-containing protein, partial [Terriglobia bacterium]